MRKADLWGREKHTNMSQSVGLLSGATHMWLTPGSGFVIFQMNPRDANVAS